MRLVRCDACGAKAMLAASQCPKCAKPLYVRNERGDEVRLVRCRSCETFYPASRDGCRWCPAVARKSIPRGTGTAIAAGLTLAASLGGWQFVRPGSPPSPAPNVMPVQASAVPRLASVAVVTPAVNYTAPRAKVSSVAVSDTVAHRAQPAPSPAAPRALVTQPSVPANESKPTGDASSFAELVSAKATTWVNVRAEANGASEIVGIILPDSVVELGESRRGWRRVSTRSFSGWASAKLFTVDSLGR